MANEILKETDLPMEGWVEVVACIANQEALRRRTERAVGYDSGNDL